MADIKTIKGPMIFRPGLSEEDKAAAVEALEKHFVGAEQSMRGQARADAVEKFLELLKAGGSAERVAKLEAQIKELHSMDKFPRFRTQLLLLMMDVFQGGMHFALDKKAMDNNWDLLQVLGLAAPPANQPSK
jgi:hypothetical protein